MNHEFDTPPNGDFVRYLERITAPSPGAVKPGLQAMVRERTAMHLPSTPPQSRAANRDDRGPVQGPPDLATILRQVAGQIAGEFRKNSNRR